ncbi:MAG: peptidylprolyl isomerase [Pseudomonadota bacterium]
MIALVFSMTLEANAVDEKYLLIELENGTVKIEMLPEVAPKHIAQITTLAKRGDYDGVAFHRVIDGFMAQTGDVQHGKVADDGSVSSRAGTGGSDLGNIEAEFSDKQFDRGVVGMARAQAPNSANSQFFIMFEDGHFLNNNYTVWGRVVEGMELVDNIKRGAGSSGTVTDPDRMVKVTVSEE